MFLADVAMGKVHYPTSGWGKKIPAGYDSMFAKGGQSGVYNNEMIVYKLHQVSLKYLVEFSD
jgi:poly [ADP-ribose] polymerase